MNATGPIKSLQRKSTREFTKSERNGPSLNQAYITPKHLLGYFGDMEKKPNGAVEYKFTWASGNNAQCKEKKLDYISLFGEDSKPD